MITEFWQLWILVVTVGFFILGITENIFGKRK